MFCVFNLLHFVVSLLQCHICFVVFCLLCCVERGPGLFALKVVETTQEGSYIHPRLGSHGRIFPSSLPWGCKPVYERGVGAQERARKYFLAVSP